MEAFKQSPIDLTLVGLFNQADGLARIGISVTDCLKNELAINHIDIRPGSLKDIPLDIATILINPNKTAGNVTLYYWPLSFLKWEPSDFVPKESHIKLAYSMFESSRIPEKWVTILNERFDAVIVPDEWLKSVYITSGVKIPIFCLPLVLDLEDFLNQPVKKVASKPFRFGCSAAFLDKKNQCMLIDAFHAEFGNNPDVELLLHGRNGHPEYMQEMRKKIQKLGNPSIKIIEQSFSNEQHKSFLKSLDCYVLISKGEGFSITPRESLALGIPTIISNNTAHEVICKSTYVRSVTSIIREEAHYDSSHHFGDCGDYFACSILDVQEALRNVYINYEEYLEKALAGREWVKRYLKENLKNQYLSLIKPKKVILGSENSIGEDFIMTNSELLYYKYLDLLNSH